jgi:hypothetical protein
MAIVQVKADAAAMNFMYWGPADRGDRSGDFEKCGELIKVGNPL